MIQEQVRCTIENKKLIQKGDKLLVCVSGGPDSIALIYLLLGLKKTLDIELAIAHLDHMIRGKRSSADADFVKKVAAKLNIPCIVEKKDVKKFAGSRKMSIEEAAREVRYDFYRRAADKIGANKIATGHNMDDQAETVLMRLIKGAGSLGLSGIPYKRRLESAWVIRPLLDIKRTDIEKYLKKRKIPSRTDASNFKTFYLRNKIRHILIPLLMREFNPRITENLKLIAKNLSDEFNYLDTVIRHLYKRLTKKTERGIEINVQSLLRQHIALQRLIARHIIYALKGDLKKITYKHWQEIEGMLIYEDKTSLDLPGRIRVKKRNGRLIFAVNDIKRKCALHFKKSAKLKIPGEVAIPELGIKLNSKIVTSIPVFKKGKKKKEVEYINGDSLSSPFKIRTWHKGDRMKPLGMKSLKKLHDIFIDEKVPREIRGRIPLVTSGNKILWAVGVKLSEDCRVNRNTERVVKLAVMPSGT